MLEAWLKKWGQRYGKLCQWVEDNIEETLAYYRLPQSHNKHLKSTNMLERLNEELKRRTLVVRIFPNGEICLRLVRALAVEIHGTWVEATRYLNMADLGTRQGTDAEDRSGRLRRAGLQDRATQQLWSAPHFSFCRT